LQQKTNLLSLQEVLNTVDSISPEYSERSAFRSVTMLASPTSTIQRRHRQHRRQNSTPLGLEAVKVPNLPAPAMQRYAMHRRGLSLDQRAANLQPSPLSLKGGEATYQQPHNVLRETQQRFTRQGHPYLNHSNISMSSNSEYQSFSQDGVDGYTNLHSNENFPNNACMSPEAFSGANQVSKDQHLNLKVALERIQQQQQHELDKASMSYGAGPNHQFVGNPTWNPYVLERSGLPVINANSRRMSVQSDLSQHSYRPSTPTNQINPSK
jgi:regulatory protein SWI5